MWSSYSSRRIVSRLFFFRYLFVRWLTCLCLCVSVSFRRVQSPAAAILAQRLLVLKVEVELTERLHTHTHTRTRNECFVDRGVRFLGVAASDQCSIPSFFVRWFLCLVLSCCFVCELVLRIFHAMRSDPSRATPTHCHFGPRKG